MKVKILLVACLMVGATHSFADDTDEMALLSIYGDEQLINIATGYSKPLSKAPAVASVITAEEIKRMGALDIDDALETIPGLHVSRDSIAYGSIYTFRGILADYNPQILFLINGVPMKSLLHGNRHQVWAGMPVEMVSRIEVIRGPGSAIYGADAFAGVINIITKEAGELEGFTSGIRRGSFNTKEAWAQWGFKNDYFDGILSGEYEKTNGQDEIIASDAQSFLDMLTGTNASLAPGSVNLGRESYEFRVELSREPWILRAGYQQREGQNGAGAVQALDSHNIYSSKRYNIDLVYEKKNYFENLDLKADLSFLKTTQEVDRDLVLFPPGSTGPFFTPEGIPMFGVFPNGVIGNPEVYEKHYRANFSTLYTGISDHELSIGTGYYLGDMYDIRETKNYGFNPETLPDPSICFGGSFIDPAGPLVNVTDTSCIYLPENERENSYVYLQDVWKFLNDWELTAGVRYDHYSDFGDTTNPRLALVWATSRTLTSKILYGEAFRAPSFSQTQAINNPLVFGNPELDPETLKSYELAFEYRPDETWTYSLNLFYYRWEDIIQFVPDPGGASNTAQNIGEQTGKGLEFETKWQPREDFELIANYALQKSRDKSTSTDAADSPEQQFYIMANWNFCESFSANIQANHVRDRIRAINDPRKDIDDYTLVDLTLRSKLSEQWEAALIVKNLFDEDAREPSPMGDLAPLIPDDLPLAGRAIMGELRFTLR